MNTLFIDTNVFIRLLTRDNELLYTRAREIYKRLENNECKGVVSILVVNEVLWVLENFYELERKMYVDAFCMLLAFPSIDIYEVKKDVLMDILRYFKETSFDFTDIYLRRFAKTGDIVSFDKDMQKIDF